MLIGLGILYFAAHYRSILNSLYLFEMVVLSSLSRVKHKLSAEKKVPLVSNIFHTLTWWVPLTASGSLCCFPKVCGEDFAQCVTSHFCRPGLKMRIEKWPRRGSFKDSDGSNRCDFTLHRSFDVPVLSLSAAGWVGMEAVPHILPAFPTVIWSACQSDRRQTLRRVMKKAIFTY